MQVTFLWLLAWLEQEEENRLAAAAAAMLRGPRPVAAPAASGQATFAAQVQDGLRKAQVSSVLQQGAASFVSQAAQA